VLLVPGTFAGGIEVSRWFLISQVIGAEWGVAVLAVILSLFTAAAGLWAGQFVDSHDPRIVLTISYSLSIVSTATTFVLLLSGTPPLWWLLVSTALIGVATGLALSAVLKIQAAIVRPGAAGGAEMLNVLRLGIGGVLGAVLVGSIPDLVTTMGILTALISVALVLVLIVLRPVHVPRVSRMASGAGSALEYLKSQDGMRRLVTYDLALTFVLPTQLVNLVLVGELLQDVASWCIGAGMVGVLLGRAALLLFGFPRNITRFLRLSMIGLVACQVASALMLIDNWLLQAPVLMVIDIAVSTVLLTYGQGLLAATIQQNLDEAVRGRVSGVVVAARAVLVSLAALVAAAISQRWNSEWLLWSLAASLTLVIVATRGFSGVRARLA